MAGPTDFDIGKTRRSLFFHVAVTEGAIQFKDVLMKDMVEKNRLIDVRPGENREQREEDLLRLNLIAMIGNDGKKKDAKNDKKYHEFLLHSD
jgi:hypothetical protein